VLAALLCCDQGVKGVRVDFAATPHASFDQLLDSLHAGQSVVELLVAFAEGVADLFLGVVK